MQCHQGNAAFSSNVAQFTSGYNQCDHYLSVDNKERPTYSDVGASFIFEYEDGELCSGSIIKHIIQYLINYQLMIFIFRNPTTKTYHNLLDMRCKWTNCKYGSSSRSINL